MTRINSQFAPLSYGTSSCGARRADGASQIHEVTEACVNNSLPQTNAAPRGAQASCLQITEKIKAKTRRL